MVLPIYPVTHRCYLEEIRIISFAKNQMWIRKKKSKVDEKIGIVKIKRSL